MKFTVAASALIGAMVAGTFGMQKTVTAQHEQSQWDGIYTEEQAKRGDALYAEYCGTCHAADLAGGEMAPALVGGDFASNWNDLALGELFERIRTTMPANGPGILSRQQNADILAYMLSRSTAPAGKTELPQTAEELNAIKFKASKPEGAAPKAQTP